MLLLLLTTQVVDLDGDGVIRAYEMRQVAPSLLLILLLLQRFDVNRAATCHLPPATCHLSHAAYRNPIVASSPPSCCT